MVVLGEMKTFQGLRGTLLRRRQRGGKVEDEVVEHLESGGAVYVDLQKKQLARLI